MSLPGFARTGRALVLGAVGAVLLAVALATVDRLNAARSEALVDRLTDEIMADVGVDTIRIVHELIDPVAASLRVVAEVESVTPSLFRGEASVNILYKALTAAPQIDAVYTTFEDGFHRVVTRIDKNRRQSDPKIPVAANWHSSWVNPFQDDVRRRRNRTFYDTWPHVVGRYGVDEPTDQRKALWQYREAKRTGRLAISEPIINPDTGFPMVALGYPITHNGEFAGVASANLTMETLSEFLQARKASPNSVTAIFSSDGVIVGYPDPAQMAKSTGGRLEVRKVGDLAEPQVVTAVQARGERDRFTFRAGPANAEYIAVFAAVPAVFGKTWQIVVVAPVSDFVGKLRQDDTHRLALFAALVAAMFVIVAVAAWMLAVPPRRVP